MIHILPIQHNEILCISFKGWLEGEAFKFINTFPGRRYSTTFKRYYIPYSADAFQKITLALKKVTDIDVSEWSDTVKVSEPVHTKALVIIPAIYRETMVKKRYSPDRGLVPILRSTVTVLQ